MTGTGPVEPVNSSETDDSYDVIGVDEPRLTDRWGKRWNTLSPRTRKATLAATATATATAVAATAILLAQGPAEPDRPNPVPWPANVTAWHYLGPATPTNSRTTTGRFRFAISVDHGPPVTLRVIGTSSPGLHARAIPEPDFTVTAGTPRRITVEITVSDCSDLPLNADLPFLDVTLRNTRAIQRHSFIFGGAFSRELSELLHTACDPPTPRSAPRPTGSASSQNAD